MYTVTLRVNLHLLSVVWYSYNVWHSLVNGVISPSRGLRNKHSNNIFLLSQVSNCVVITKERDRTDERERERGVGKCSNEAEICKPWQNPEGKTLRLGHLKAAVGGTMGSVRGLCVCRHRSGIDPFRS